MHKLELDAPNLGRDEIRSVRRAIKKNYVSTFGPFVSTFEEQFAQYIGSKNAVSLQSGTAALHMALFELGIGQDDEVIIPALTFIATINPILYVGANPVIVDVDPETWNIDPKEIAKAITEKTRAVIPVHLYGNPCEMDAIMKLADKHNLYVIEDATESLGAVYKGRQTGTFGAMGCFSFNGNKIITTGGGGMIVSEDVEKAEHIRFLINQAKDNENGFYHPEMGFNLRMTNIEAALGIAQLRKIEYFLTKKRKLRNIYMEILEKLPNIEFQKETYRSKGSCWLTCAKVNDIDEIDNIIQKLGEHKIPTRRIFMPVSEMNYLKEFTFSCSNALEIFERGICFPSSTLNKEKYVKKTASIIEKIIS